MEEAEGRQEFRIPRRGRWAWANEGRQAMPGKKNPKKSPDSAKMTKKSPRYPRVLMSSFKSPNKCISMNCNGKISGMARGKTGFIEEVEHLL